MKKSFIFKSMLMMALLCVPFVLVSCDDDDDDGVSSVSYVMGFNTFSKYDPAEPPVIENAYLEALGVSSTYFTLSGSISECDKVVISACQSAEAVLDTLNFTGSYEFIVTNNTSDQTIYTYQIN